MTERVRDATTLEEIKDIKSLVKTEWKIDDFIHNCRGLIDITIQNMQDLKVNAGMYSSHYVSAKTFTEWLFKGSLERLEGKIQNNQFGGWGTWEAKVALFRESGMKWSHYITCEALKDELEKTYGLVKEKVEQKKVEWDWKNYSLFTSKKAPTSTSRIPSTSSPNPVPQPEPNIPSDNNKKTPPLSETEKNQKLEELKIKSADLAKKDNSKKPLSKEEKEQKIAEIEKQINKLEEEGGDENLKNILAKMKEQMGEVQRRLAEIKKNLKEVLESVKDYTSKLFNWFKSKNAKKITLQDNGELLVESNDGKSKTISVETIKNNEVLS